ncbi:MAG: hypothetical protein J6R16_00015 [Alistipes sp.]|nr:hypothetical protein [Alistipes sp.]
MKREDVKVSREEACSGKYKSISHLNGESYATVWYVGGEINPEMTYTDRYCRSKGLGKYAKSNSSKSSSSSSRRGTGFGAAAGGGIVGLVKNAVEETPEEKAEREREEREDERIQDIIDYQMKHFKKNLKAEYPLTGSTDELVPRIKELMAQAEEYKLEQSHPDKLHSRLAEAKKKATAWLAFRICKRVKKQDKELFDSPELKALRRRASRLSGRTLIMGVVIFYILLFLFIAIVCSI